MDATRTSAISSRAQRLVDQPPFAEYIREHLGRSSDPFHPEHDPAGYIGLCTAENKLVADLVLERLGAVRDVPASVLGYDTMIGSGRFRRLLAAFLEETFIGRPVSPDHLAVLAGAGSVLETLFYALCEPGDGVLVPTPSYAGFWADLETRDEIRIVPVHGESGDGFRLTTGLLDAAVASAGRPIKALLFTSPNNPLGTVYDAREVEDIVAWSEDREIHVVFDEIYALSVYGAAQFVSAARLRPGLGERTHIVWAFSKDFGASGLRCGVLLSENEQVLGAIEGLAYWCAVSGHTQHLLGDLVADSAWVRGYVEELALRLGNAASRVGRALDAAGIPHLPADAGIFVLCDLRAFLDEPTWEAEDRLWRRILREANVNLTPGSACRINEPGFFRLCFAAVPTEAAEEGIRRVHRVLRRQGE